MSDVLHLILRKQIIIAKIKMILCFQIYKIFKKLNLLILPAKNIIFIKQKANICFTQIIKTMQ